MPVSVSVKVVWICRPSEEFPQSVTVVVGTEKSVQWTRSASVCLTREFNLLLLASLEQHRHTTVACEQVPHEAAL